MTPVCLVLAARGPKFREMRAPTSLHTGGPSYSAAAAQAERTVDYRGSVVEVQPRVAPPAASAPLKLPPETWDALETWQTDLHASEAGASQFSTSRSVAASEARQAVADDSSQRVASIGAAAQALDAEGRSCNCPEVLTRRPLFTKAVCCSAVHQHCCAPHLQRQPQRKRPAARPRTTRLTATQRPAGGTA